MEIGEREGQVVIQFSGPVGFVALDPQMAFEVGEKIARAAHGAKFGSAPPFDGSYLAQQVRARVTEDLRDRMVARVAIVMPQLIEKHRAPGHLAMQVVDIVLSMAQGREV